MSSWWSDKLKGQAPAPRVVPPMTPATGYTTGYAVPQQQQLPPAEILSIPEESHHCPSCGSGNYFARGGKTKIVNVKTGGSFSPAPVCFDCGHPNEQYSSHTGTGGSLMATRQAAEVRGKGHDARIASTFTTGFHARDSGAHHDGPGRIINGEAV